MRAFRGPFLVAISLLMGGCGSNGLVHGDAAVGTGGAVAATGGSSGAGGVTGAGGGSHGAGGSAGGAGGGPSGAGGSVGAGGHAGATGGVDAAVDSAPDGQISCGGHLCAAGDYCCNASCGICAPRGAACIQIVCPVDARIRGDASGCVAVPALDGSCTGALTPHAYRCALADLPVPPCVSTGVGNVTDSFCCP